MQAVADGYPRVSIARVYRVEGNATAATAFGAKFSLRVRPSEACPIQHVARAERSMRPSNICTL
jgi:hypothetical protein